MSSIPTTSSRENEPSTSPNQCDLVVKAGLHGYDQGAINQGFDDDFVQIQAGDIVIAVLGPSGSGKSAFINAVAGRQVAPTGAGLESCTQKVRAYKCKHPVDERYVTLVDTPGLDDSDRTDFTVLDDVTKWLHDTYIQKILLSGVLQLHNISERRMRGPQLRGLHTLNELCGTEAKTNLIMLTTFWDIVDGKLAAAREAELIDKFWRNDFLADGAMVRRLDPGTQARAWEIVDLFQVGARLIRKPLRVQIEMGDNDKPFYGTSVFRYLLQYWTSIVDAIWGAGQSPSSPSPLPKGEKARKFRKPTSDQASATVVTHSATDSKMAKKQQEKLIQAVPEDKRKEFLGAGAGTGMGTGAKRKHSFWIGQSISKKHAKT